VFLDYLSSLQMKAGFWDAVCMFTQLKISINWSILIGLDMPVVPMVATLWFF